MLNSRARWNCYLRHSPSLSETAQVRTIVDDSSPRTKGARRCTNPDCEHGGRRVVGKMVRTKNGKLLCRGKGCHTIYAPSEVIDPENDDH